MKLFKDYKDFFERECELEYHDTHVIREQIDALVAAYEQSQVELAVCKNNLSLALDRDLETQNKLERSDEKLVDALARLAKTQAELAEAKATLDDFTPYIRAQGTPYKEQIADLRKKLDLRNV